MKHHMLYQYHTRREHANHSTTETVQRNRLTGNIKIIYMYNMLYVVVFNQENCFQYHSTHHALLIALCFYRCLMKVKVQTYI